MAYESNLTDLEWDFIKKILNPSVIEEMNINLAKNPSWTPSVCAEGWHSVADDAE